MKPIKITSDKRFKLGNIKKTGEELRGNPETMKMERMKIPPNMPLEMQLNPPIVISPELAKVLKRKLNKGKEN